MLGILIVIAILAKKKRLTDRTVLIVCASCGYGFSFLTLNSRLLPMNELVAGILVNGTFAFVIFSAISFFVFRKKIARADTLATNTAKNQPPAE